MPNVEFLVTAREALTTKVLNAWADRGLYQRYGPSETRNIRTVRPHVTKYHAINNIGPPLRNTSVFVVSEGDEFCFAPRGGEGEFCLWWRASLASYLDHNQSVGKFINYPKYGRLYCSGDFARLRPDGSLSFTGGKDDQAKLRGQRIELDEINSVLPRSPEVEDYITLIIDGNNRLNSGSYASGSRMKVRCASLQVSHLLQLLRNFSNLYRKLYQCTWISSALIPVSSLPSNHLGED